MAFVSDPDQAGFNAYVSVAEADVFASEDLFFTNWASADNATKEVAITTATRLLDQYVEWDGSVAASDQELAWPRQFVREFNRPADEYLPSDVIPDPIKYLTARYAESLLSGEDPTADKETGIASVGVGSVSVVFNKLDRKQPVPSFIRVLAGHYGTVRSGSTRTVEVTRR